MPQSIALSHEMEYRRLGKTELEISILGFGASPLGGVFGPSDTQEGARAVHLAIDEGINFFDVSPYYGLTIAEERLGEALIGKRNRVLLSTKCGRYGLHDFDFSAKRVQASVEESLKRLRTDYLDLLHVHDVEFGSVDQIVSETLPAIRNIQAQGKVRYVGISGYPLKILMRIAQQVPIDCILSYCRYDLLANDLDSVLMPVAEGLGVGVINAAPLHMGMLTDKPPPSWHPAPLSVRSAVHSAQLFCWQHGIDLSDLALRFCLNYPRVATTLIGMGNVEEVQRNLRTLRTPANAEFAHQVQATLAPVANVVWSSGITENHD